MTLAEQLRALGAEERDAVHAAEHDAWTRELIAIAEQVNGTAGGGAARYTDHLVRRAEEDDER